MWVKICGITNLEDACVAVDSGADALGFVFAPSPRQITVESAREISRKLPRSVEKIGVFVNATPHSIIAAVEMADLTGVQLHGDDSGITAQVVRELTRTFSGGICIVQVLHCGKDTEKFASELHAISVNPAVDRILVDTSVAGKQGGTGVPFDWAATRASFAREGSRVLLIAAGGLNSENVARAIQMLQPWGVDVSSGVEAAPGRKDRQRVEAFLRTARAAEPRPISA